jgi:hypothetical protein
VELFDIKKDAFPSAQSFPRAIFSSLPIFLTIDSGGEQFCWRIIEINP